MQVHVRLLWEYSAAYALPRLYTRLQAYFCNGMYSAPDARKKSGDLLRLLEMWRRVRQAPSAEPSAESAVVAAGGAAAGKAGEDDASSLRGVVGVWASKQRQRVPRGETVKRPERSQLEGDLLLLEMVGAVKPIALHHDELLKQLQEDARESTQAESEEAAEVQEAAADPGSACTVTVPYALALAEKAAQLDRVSGLVWGNPSATGVDVRVWEGCRCCNTGWQANLMWVGFTRVQVMDPKQSDEPLQTARMALKTFEAACTRRPFVAADNGGAAVEYTQRILEALAQCFETRGMYEEHAAVSERMLAACGGDRKRPAAAELAAPMQPPRASPALAVGVFRTSQGGTTAAAAAVSLLEESLGLSASALGEHHMCVVAHMQRASAFKVKNFA